MRDIDEDSDIEDIKKRDGILMKIVRRHQEEGKEERVTLMKIVTLKTSRRGERGEK